MSVHAPVPGRYVAEGWPYSDLPPEDAGVFCFAHEDRALLFLCPCGCGQPGALPIVRAGEARPDGVSSWVWDGNRERPTLQPSIRRGGSCPGYHGHLVAGTWTFENDSRWAI